MERLDKAMVFTCIEEPGDSTRYTHLIHVTHDYVVVYRDEIGNGAGLNPPHLFMRSLLEKMIPKWEWLNTTAAVNEVKDLSCCTGTDGHNPWTFASAIRCSHVVLKHLNRKVYMRNMEE